MTTWWPAASWPPRWPTTTSSCSESTQAERKGTNARLQLIGSLAHWLIGSLAHWLIGSLAHWLIGSLAQRLQDRLHIRQTPLRRKKRNTSASIWRSRTMWPMILSDSDKVLGGL